MLLDSVTAAASKVGLEGDAGTCELEVVDLGSEYDEIGDGDGVGQPIIEGEVRAQPSIGCA